MLMILEVLTLVWLTGWLVFAIINLQGGNQYSVNWLMIVHYFFNGLPLALDLVLGSPEFGRYPGFAVASADEITSAIYCVYMALVPVIFWVVGRPRRCSIAPRELGGQTTRFSGRLKHLWPVLIIPIILPVVLALFAPDPGVYTHYAVSTTGRLSPDAARHHILIGLAARFSIGAAALLLWMTPKLRTYHFLLVLPSVVGTVWLHGKRSIIAMTIVVFAYVFWDRGILRGFRLIAFGIMAVVLMVGFSAYYQTEVRDLDSSRDARGMVENFRIDYGRDSQIRMTIYAELHRDDLQILEYRGQSFVFYATMYVPRSIWPEKPLPYAQYFTSALFFTEPRLWGWGMTTSILEEAIANFSWAGILIGPTIPALICHVSDTRANGIIRALGTLIAIMFLVLHFVSFAPLAILWLACVGMPRIIWSRSSKPKVITFKVKASP